MQINSLHSTKRSYILKNNNSLLRNPFFLPQRQRVWPSAPPAPFCRVIRNLSLLHSLYSGHMQPQTMSKTLLVLSHLQTIAVTVLLPGMLLPQLFPWLTPSYVWDLSWNSPLRGDWTITISNIRCCQYCYSWLLNHINFLLAARSTACSYLVWLLVSTMSASLLE